MSDYDNPRPSSQPVGSTDQAVAKDDLITLDRMVSGPSGLEITNRKGAKLTPLVDIIDSAQSQVNVSIQESLNTPLGDGQWGIGKTFTEYNQYLVYDKVYYKPLVVPYTTQGADPTATPDNTNVSPTLYEQSDIEMVARSLNLTIDQVIDSADTASLLDDKIAIYDSVAQKTYYKPSGVGAGESILTVNNDTLTTSSATYSLSPYTPLIIIDTVSDIQKLPRVIGSKVQWSGYYEVGDGGGNCGTIKDGAHVADGGSIFTISGDIHVVADNMFSSVGIQAARFGVTCDNAGFDYSERANAAIKFAYKNKVSVLAQDRIWSNTVIWPAAKDCELIAGIFILSGIVLDFNGCRVSGGDTGAGTKVYDPLGVHCVTSGYLDIDTDNLLSNIDLALNSQRLIASKIINATFAFTNCAMNLANVNEQCEINNINYSANSRNIRAKACFYLTLNDHISRSSAFLVGEPAFELYGGANNAITFSAFNVINAGKGVSIAGPANFTIAFINGSSFEESTSVSGIGVCVEVGAFVSGLSFGSTYFEGTSIALENSGNIFGMSTISCIYNNNEYAIKTVGAGSSLRNITWLGNSHPDDGGVDRNLIDVSIGNNDSNFQVPDIVGFAGVTATVADTTIHGNQTAVDLEYNWITVAADDLLARSTAPKEAKNDLIKLPYTGRGGVKLTNEVPYCTIARSGDDIIINTQIVYDDLNMIAFNFFGNSSGRVHDVKGVILGDYVNQMVGISDLVVTIESTAPGSDLAVRISSTSIPFGAVLNISGAIRHM